MSGWKKLPVSILCVVWFIAVFGPLVRTGWMGAASGAGLSDEDVKKKAETKPADAAPIVPRDVNVRLEAQRALILFGETPLDTVGTTHLENLRPYLRYANDKTKAAILGELERRFRDVTYGKARLVERLRERDKLNNLGEFAWMEARALMQRPDAALSDLILAASVLREAPQEDFAAARAALKEWMVKAKTKEEVLGVFKESRWTIVVEAAACVLIDRSDVSAEDLIRYMDHPTLTFQKSILFAGLKLRTAELRTLAERAE